jgi:hypothetical protein
MAFYVAPADTDPLLVIGALCKVALLHRRCPPPVSAQSLRSAVFGRNSRTQGTWPNTACRPSVCRQPDNRATREVACKARRAPSGQCWLTRQQGRRDGRRRLRHKSGVT